MIQTHLTTSKQLTITTELSFIVIEKQQKGVLVLVDSEMITNSIRDSKMTKNITLLSEMITQWKR